MGVQPMGCQGLDGRIPRAWVEVPYPRISHLFIVVRRVGAGDPGAGAETTKGGEMETILVAGASGQLGRYVVHALKRHGYRVRALTREPARLREALGGDGAADEVVQADLCDAASLAGACDGVHGVIGCAGASMDLNAVRDRRSFADVDARGNANLLAEARRAGVRRFVYVSLHGGPAMAGEYAAAHESFVAALGGSGIAHTVVRPTGFFSFLGEILRMAEKGRGPVIGDGSARTNPIHEADLAEVCVAALTSDAREIAAGGPQTLTRREIVETAFAAAGRRPRILRVPVWIFRGVAVAARPFNPRLAALLAFGADVSQVDCVAPARGTRTLDAYFRELAGR